MCGRRDQRTLSFTIDYHKTSTYTIFVWRVPFSQQ